MQPIRRAACLAGAILAATPCWAGPPYVTDDPEPTRNGGWENYVYLSGTATPGTVAGQAGASLNYGAAENLQLSLTLPESALFSRGLSAGPGDIDIGAKYRVVHSAGKTWLPDIAVFPSATLPTARQGFGAPRATAFLPVWMEKDAGPWSLFGGGGYMFNPGPRQRNSGLFGLALTRKIGQAWTIGLEITHQTPAVAGARAATNLGAGVIYQMSMHWALMASGGPGLQAPSRTDLANFYVSLQFTN